MKASELRIGNYIISGNNGEYDKDMTIGKVLEIGSEEREFEQIYCECEESFEWFFKDNYFGIPLTEEWLIKFGAIDRNKEERDRFNFKEINWYFGFTEPYGDFRIYQHPDSFKYWLDQYHTIEIKHIHQLQNLYFALTGEELTIK